MSIYPVPLSIQLNQGKFLLTQKLKVYADNDAVKPLILLTRRFYERYGVSLEVVTREESSILLEKIDGKTESYRLMILEDRITIGAADYKGFVHAVETIVQMVKPDLSLQCMEVYDEPFKQYRGIHLYMPAPEYIDECKRLFDALSFLKYNTVILEVGGTMELKKHPEVNQAWVSFCQMVVNKFPGGPQNFQWSDRYWKDSTHYENARGRILKKDMVRELVQYAKDLGFTVIPEIPALSHCYYLTLAHREIAEDLNDIFPDTYCPMNENSYRLYFEVAEEVIEVFEPEIVSIGHDEIRIMGECPRCRNKSGHELLAYEINRLHDFYKEHNIRIMMWCEKLLKPIRENSTSWGGGEEEKIDVYGRYWKLPAMYQAIDRIPQDILMLDWYHSRSDNTEENFTQNGFEVLFGNYSGLVFGNWDIRSERVIGAEISTWCTPDEYTLGRNGVLFDLIFSAQMLWGREYCDQLYSEYLKNAMNMAETVRKIMRGEKVGKIDKEVQLLFCAQDGVCKIETAKAECHGSNAVKVVKKCGELVGVPVDKAHIVLHTDIYAESLLLCESFSKPEEHLMSYNFLTAPHWDEAPISGNNYLCAKKPRWSAATHEILYEDGSWELINAVYGITAADTKMTYDRERLYLGERVHEIDEAQEKKESFRKESPHYKICDPWQSAVLYFTDTIVSGDTTVYVYEWKNPHPEKKIICIKAVNTTHDREQSVILYALGWKEAERRER